MPLTRTDHEVPLLTGEHLADLTPESVARRVLLQAQLQVLPEESLTGLQYLQPQVGCFNRCTFCSQRAGTDIWQLTRAGLRDLLAAVAGCLRDRTGPASVLGGDRTHKAGVLFPYVDNDIASYPHLDEYAEVLAADLGGRVRITTVGFSARNATLRDMHRRLAGMPARAVAGFRLSFTPYTYGATAGAHGRGDADLDRFEEDVAFTLRTYRPLVERLGRGRETACVELRFAPLAVRAPVTETVVRGRHVLAAGPHLLVATEPGGDPPPSSRLVGIRNNEPGRRDLTGAPLPVLSAPPRPYLLATSDSWAEEGVEAYAHRVLDPGADTDPAVVVRPVGVHLLSNPDGPYYAADPGFDPDGRFRTLYVYPASGRRAAGYNDATRYFLDEVLACKRDRGLARRAEFPDATAEDVTALCRRLADRADRLERTDRRAAAHLRDGVLPLVTSYARVLARAGYPASDLFSRRFSVDTGQIVNQGRARTLFGGLAGADDQPLTLWEERTNLISDSKGSIWRMAPVPFDTAGGLVAPGRRGGKNPSGRAGSLLLEELSARYVAPTDVDTGRPLRQFRIEGVELERVRLRDAGEGSFPGAVAGC